MLSGRLGLMEEFGERDEKLRNLKRQRDYICSGNWMKGFGSTEIMLSVDDPQNML